MGVVSVCAVIVFGVAITTAVAVGTAQSGSLLGMVTLYVPAIDSPK